MQTIYEILQKTEDGWRCIAASRDKSKIKQKYELLKKTTLSKYKMVTVFKNEQNCSKLEQW